MSVDVLVCNLTRLGDLLQTQPLINDLHEAGFSAGIVCQQNFSGALPLLRNVSQSWTLPGARLLSSLDSSWPQALSLALDFAKKVNDEAKPKYIINLTPSLPARLLAKLLGKGAKLLGFGIDELGYGRNEGVWSSFISVAARQRINAPFNVADMMRRLARPLTGNGGGDFHLAEPDEKAMAWAEAFLRPYKGKASAFIGFQPGASADNRRWPIESFRKLGGILWRKAGVIPLLFGSPGEAALADEYGAGADHPWLSAIGKTGLTEAAALLKKCRLLVSNDTGTMHLAAGQDTPVLAFFLATAQPWDTGPLKPGSCCLEPLMDCHPCPFTKKCAHNDCRRAISPESAGDLVLGWLESGNWSGGVTDRVNKECRVWLTARDAGNLADLKLISQGREEERCLWLPLLRGFWSQFLDSFDNPEKPQAIARAAPPLPQKIAAEAAPILAQAGEILESIHACGQLMMKSPKAGGLFLKNCERLQSLLDSAPSLAALAAFWKDFRDNQGNDLAMFMPAVERLARRSKDFAALLQRPAPQGAPGS